MGKVVETKVIIEGVKEIEANAIGWVFEQIRQSQATPKAHLKALETKCKEITDELEYLYKVEKFLDEVDNLSALYRDTKEKISKLEKTFELYTTYKTPHETQIKQIDDTLNKMKSHIKEIDKGDHVIYQYDTTYFEPFMDLAFVLYQAVPQEKQQGE